MGQRLGATRLHILGIAQSHKLHVKGTCQRRYARPTSLCHPHRLLRPLGLSWVVNKATYTFKYPYSFHRHRLGA